MYCPTREAGSLLRPPPALFDDIWWCRDYKDELHQHQGLIWSVFYILISMGGWEVSNLWELLELHVILWRRSPTQILTVSSVLFIKILFIIKNVLDAKYYKITTNKEYRNLRFWLLNAWTKNKKYNNLLSYH